MIENGENLFNGLTPQLSSNSQNWLYTDYSNVWGWYDWQNLLHVFDQQAFIW